MRDSQTHTDREVEGRGRQTQRRSRGDTQTQQHKQKRPGADSSKHSEGNRHGDTEQTASYRQTLRDTHSCRVSRDYQTKAAIMYVRVRTFWE